MTVGTDVESLYFETLGRGQRAGVEEVTEVVLRTEEEWEAFQERLQPGQPLRPVDFSQMMVLVAAVPVTSGGYMVTFESVEQTDSSIVATYMLTMPADDCITTMALAAPYEVVAVRRTEGEVAFERRTEEMNCEFDLP